MEWHLVVVVAALGVIGWFIRAMYANHLRTHATDIKQIKKDVGEIKDDFKELRKELRGCDEKRLEARERCRTELFARLREVELNTTTLQASKVDKT